MQLKSVAFFSLHGLKTTRQRRCSRSLVVLCCLVVLSCFVRVAVLVFCPWEADIHCIYKIFFLNCPPGPYDGHMCWGRGKKKSTQVQLNCCWLNNFPTDLIPYYKYLLVTVIVLSGHSSGFLSTCGERFWCALDLLYIFWHKGVCLCLAAALKY